MTQPLADKRLEAAAQIVSSTWIWPQIEYARSFARDNPDFYIAILQAAIRETLAGEMAEALEKVIAACDSGYHFERGAGGMTIDASLRRSVINGVPAMAVEDARAILARFKEISG